MRPPLRCPGVSGADVVRIPFATFGALLEAAYYLTACVILSHAWDKGGLSALSIAHAAKSCGLSCSITGKRSHCPARDKTGAESDVVPPLDCQAVLDVRLVTWNREQSNENKTLNDCL